MLRQHRRGEVLERRDQLADGSCGFLQGRRFVRRELDAQYLLHAVPADLRRKPQVEIAYPVAARIVPGIDGTWQDSLAVVQHRVDHLRERGRRGVERAARL